MTVRCAGLESPTSPIGARAKLSKNMRILTLALLAAATLSAQGKTVTCEDGRVVVDNRTSPFQPSPCVSPLPEPEVDIEFLLVYGPPPVAGKDNVANRVARATYETHKSSFRGLIEPPPSFDPSPYAAWNFGEPLFFATKYGQYVRFPDAPFKACQATVSSAVISPALVITTCQVRTIQAGFCLPNLHQFIPPWIDMANSKICNPEEE